MNADYYKITIIHRSKITDEKEFGTFYDVYAMVRQLQNNGLVYTNGKGKVGNGTLVIRHCFVSQPDLSRVIARVDLNHPLSNEQPHLLARLVLRGFKGS